jgi:NADPH-dependent 2,4-dienoyl-CoA reductase/sulfur reductase-like enzyme
MLQGTQYNEIQLLAASGFNMTSTLQTTCCIVVGGPAGVMLGYLLSRKAVNVTVLEKHKNFFRDFRGDTVHPRPWS